MKKKISILMSLILSIFLLVGCGGSKGPKEYVTNYFKDVKSGTESKIAQQMIAAQLSDEDMPKEAADAMINMLGKLEVSPTDEKIDGEKATVNVTIKGVSFKTVIGNFMGNLMAEAMKSGAANMTDEETEKLVTDVLVKSINDAPVEERTGVVNLTKSGDDWKVVEDDSLLEVILGITEADMNSLLK